MPEPKNMRWTWSPNHAYCATCGIYLPAKTRIARLEKIFSSNEERDLTRNANFCEDCGINRHGMGKPPMMPQVQCLIPDAPVRIEPEEDYLTPMPRNQHGVDPSELVERMQEKEDEDREN